MTDEAKGKPETQEDQDTQEKSKQSTLDEIGNQVEKFAVKTAESIKKVIDKALASRNTVMTIRVNDDSNTKMNMLVDAGFSRAVQKALLFLFRKALNDEKISSSKIEGKLKRMEKLRSEIKTIVVSELENPDSPD